MNAGRPVRKPIVIPACLLLAVLSGHVRAQPDETVVLVNANSPPSRELAVYYAERREIPQENIIALDLPVTELMVREDYDRRLRDPLIAALRERGFIDPAPPEPEDSDDGCPAWHTENSRIRYLVSMHGVPLRISSTNLTLGPLIEQKVHGRQQTDTAAVDSELTLLLSRSGGINDFITNPFYTKHVWPPVGSSEEWFILMVARLDGPDPEGIRKRIDETLEAERYGIRGRAYFDMRAIRIAGYEVGDMWIAEAYERMLREGYECIVDNAPGVFAPDYPMSDMGYYLGWYTAHVEGAFLREDVVFKPGAVAYHLHSASAKTLRSTDRHWAGPLLARGAAATMGAVYEPYLQFTPRLDIFTDRLCSGRTFGESAWLAQRALSWQVTVVGDPLYRPFRYDLEAQIRHMEEDGHPDVAWGYMRKVNLLLRQGRFNVAIRICREQMERTQSDVLMEKLADLYALNDMLLDASALYARLLVKTNEEVTVVRVSWKWAWMLDARGQPERAAALLDQMRPRVAHHPAGRWLDRDLPSSKGIVPSPPPASPSPSP
jgi:uncharacterized protein (TIGR03790 family)